MHNSSNIKAALEEHAPRFVEFYTANVKFEFTRLTNRHGPALRGIYNTHDASYMDVIDAVTDYGDGIGMNRPYVLNEAKLAVYAEKAARDLVTSWLGKIEQKLGELEDAEARYVSGFAYLITGSRNGHKVEIDQDMIINFSKYGRAFNQFPAKITVDGKKTSAAAYAKLIIA